MRILIIFSLIFSSLWLVGCSQSSAKYDLKSPCVSNDLNPDAPCARRSLLENYPA